MKVSYIVDLKANKQNEGGSDIYVRKEAGKWQPITGIVDKPTKEGHE